ncbi:P-loop containing nucleoside triphosphate hydrolase protein [Lasiosphaeris hirsuta]|uniref:ATP-dependent RNA helicase n=1 Tax=Lasiosphaeris hirsuta TaxID=260670 RepID=A0AA40DM62_9PEZI|nr:P-loop containing nucleoside triphosphate hydrolase protein [Lasiosphaeris hirsuta]
MKPENKRKHSKASGGRAKRRKMQADAKPKKPVSVEDLGWQTVDVPEMYDDAEGFFGLEVVEGVDIVREGDKVQFIAAVKSGPTKEAEESEEFAGFSDDYPEATEDSAEKSTEKSAEESVEKFIKPAEKPAKKTAKATEKPTEQPAEKSTEEPSEKSREESTEKLTQKDSLPTPRLSTPKVLSKQDQNKKKLKDKKKNQKKALKNALNGVPEETAPETAGEEDGGDAELEPDLFSKLDELPEPEDDTGIDMSQWEPLNLSDEMISSISRLKFAVPSAIQSRAIPEIMEGHDVIGKAATGSGKTLAFGIPIVEKWLARRAAAKEGKDASHHPTALVLSPTRELAHQICDHIKKLCSGLSTGPYVCSVTGGLSLAKQQRQLEKADIIVGTPGRMWEVISTSTATLKGFRKIDFLVVDEADRILKDGSFKEAEEIFKALDRGAATNERTEEEPEPEQAEVDGLNRQTLVFSATFHKGLQQKLAGKGRVNLMGEGESLEYLLQKLNFREERPKFLDANPISQMAENLREGLLLCGDMEKDLYLYSVLLLQPTRRALVFTNSINSVRRITPLLQNLGLPAFPLHSDMIQKARLRSIERFKSSEAQPGQPANQNKTNRASGILIATDVAARGLDIPGIDLVIHYHVPRTADDYVHRSGRTARANSSGVSILLCGPKEAVPTQRLVAKVHAAAETRARKASLSITKTRKGDIVHTIDIDRKLVSRLRERVVLAKKLTDATLAKEKGNKDDNWIKKVADELGVEYDSDDLEEAGAWSGRGSGRKAKEKESREVTKAEMGQLRAALRDLLARRINTGVSELYLSAPGGVDADELLRNGTGGQFLGRVDGLGLDDL